MGLGASPWVKNLLRNDGAFQACMSHASYSRARNSERPPSKEGRKGPGIEPGYRFILYELMLHKHKLVTACQGLTMFANKWQALVQTTIARFPDGETFVFMLDDECNVPLAKGQTQRDRRKRPDSGFTPEELESLGRFRFLCNDDTRAFDEKIKYLFSGEATRRSTQGRKKCSAFELFMEKHMRTPGLREDEFEFATRWIVAGDYAGLKADQRIVIDRGVWRDSFARDITTDPFEGREESRDKVSQSFSRNRYNFNITRASGVDGDGAERAFIHIDRHGVRRIRQLDGQHLVGEADLKIARYARLCAARKDLYVVCHDTDALPILLLTMRDLVPPTGRIRRRVTLDMTTPTDEHPKHKKPRGASSDPKSPKFWNPAGLPKLPPLPGVVDMVMLWRAVHRWYKQKFSLIRSPIESFVLLLIFMGTDFVKNPPGLLTVRLWRCYDGHGLARQHLGNAVSTDGHLGTALMDDDEEAHQLLDVWADDSPAMATARLARCLGRDTTTTTGGGPGGGGRRRGFVPRSRREAEEEANDSVLRSIRERERSKPVRFVRHLSINENSITRFLQSAYLREGAKDVSKHPQMHWYMAQARRLGWQMAYWAGGDTAHGRRHEDEMMMSSAVVQQDTTDALSLHGWHWTPIVSSSSSSSAQDPDGDEGGEQDRPPPRKRQRRRRRQQRSEGDLNRRKREGHQSEPADRVAPLSVFRQRLLLQAQPSPSSET